MKKHLLLIASLFIFMAKGHAQKPVAGFSVSDDTICANDCISFFDSSSNNPTSWRWTFSGGLPNTSSDQNLPFVCYWDTGRHDVKLVVSNSFGSDSVTMNNLILVSPIPPTPTITQKGNDTLFVSTDPSYVCYQWYDSSTLIPGATDTFLVINHGGIYNIFITNINCCSIAVGPQITVSESYEWHGFNGELPVAKPAEARLGTSYAAQSNSACPCNKTAGVKNYAENNAITLYPNPASGQLIIYAPWFHAGEAVTVSIMNVLGQAASPPAPLQRRGEVVTIDVSGLAEGLYFVRISDERQLLVRRFVKE